MNRALAGLIALLLLGGCSSSSGSPGDGGSGEACSTCGDGAGADGTSGGADGGGTDGSDATSPKSDAGDSGGGDGAGNDGGDGSAPAEGGGGGEGGSPGPFCASGGCAAGEVSCSGRCVSVNDPLFGCGTCNTSACSIPNVAAASCAAGTCAITTCAPGWADCNGNAADGCEASLESATSCGSCGVQCTGTNDLCSPTQGCVSSCTPPLTQCTDRCVDLATDPNDCGSCGAASCPPLPSHGYAATCTGGTCGTPGCWAGLTYCSGSCVDTTNDGNDCGSCGHVCPAVTNAVFTCQSSQCVAGCQPGWTACSGACVATQTDAANCGACGKACGVNEVCTASACVPLASLWLATGVTASHFALDSTNLYWTDGSSGVFSVPIAGGSVTTIATGQAKPLGIAVDSTNVYWSNNLGGAVMSAPNTGGGTPQVVAATSEPGDLAVYGGNLYWIDEASSGSPTTNVWTAPVTGGTAAVAKSTGPATGNSYLIGDPGGVYVLALPPFGGGHSELFGITSGWETFVPQNNAEPLVTDGTSVYEVGASGSVDSVLGWYSAGSGTLGGSFTSYYAPTPLAANACGVLFEQDGLVELLRHPGGYVPAHLLTVLGFAASVGAADAANLYFYSSTNNAIGKLPMP